MEQTEGCLAYVLPIASRRRSFFSEAAAQPLSSTQHYQSAPTICDVQFQPASRDAWRQHPTSWERKRSTSRAISTPPAAAPLPVNNSLNCVELLLGSATLYWGSPPSPPFSTHPPLSPHIQTPKHLLLQVVLDMWSWALPSVSKSTHAMCTWWPSSRGPAGDLSP